MRLPNGLSPVVIPYCEKDELGIVPRQVYKRSWLIDILPSFKGYVNGKPNKLLFNFYSYVTTFLHNSGKTVVKTDGSTTAWGNWGCDRLRLYVGQDTEPVSFNDYTLVSSETKYFKTLSFEILSDRMRVNGQWVSDGAYKSLAWYLDQGPHDNVYRNGIINKILVTIAENQTVTVRINIFEPWTKNMGYLLGGLLTKQNLLGLVDTGGNTHDIRANNPAVNVVAGASRIVIGTGTNPFSFDDYYLESMTEIPTSHGFIYPSDYSFALAYWTSSYVPPSEMTISEIGLVQELYSSDGSTYDALMCRIVLSEPITLVPNKTNFIMIRLLAM